MTEAVIMFRAMVVLTFALSAINHFLLPRGIISRTLIILMLAGFIYTEGYIALTVDPTMWLYVSLNLWGLANFWKTRNATGDFKDITIDIEEGDIDALLGN